MSARPKNVDWSAIERDYRSGVLSLRELSKRHGINHVSIKKRADKEGWGRDLAAKIQAKAEDIVNKWSIAYIANAPAVGNDRQAIEANGNLVANVRLTHRRDIKRLLTLSASLLSELELQCIDPALLARFGELMRSPNEFGADRLNDLYAKIISTPVRVETTKKLAETLRLAIGLEREAWGIDKDKGDEKPTSALASLLMSMRVSALPVVHEVERDDNL